MMIMTPVIKATLMVVAGFFVLLLPAFFLVALGKSAPHSGWLIPIIQLSIILGMSLLITGIVNCIIHVIRLLRKDGMNSRPTNSPQ